jgi:hypothetical protein
MSVGIRVDVSNSSGLVASGQRVDRRCCELVAAVERHIPGAIDAVIYVEDVLAGAPGAAAASAAPGARRASRPLGAAHPCSAAASRSGPRRSSGEAFRSSPCDAVSTGRPAARRSQAPRSHGRPRARNSRPPSNRISCGTPPHGPRSGSITIASRIATSTSALVGYNDSAQPITSRENPSSITVSQGRTSRRPRGGSTLMSSWAWSVSQTSLRAAGSQRR